MAPTERAETLPAASWEAKASEGGGAGDLVWLFLAGRGGEEARTMMLYCAAEEARRARKITTTARSKVAFLLEQPEAPGCVPECGSWWRTRNYGLSKSTRATGAQLQAGRLRRVGGEADAHCHGLGGGFAATRILIGNYQRDGGGGRLGGFVKVGPGIHERGCAISATGGLRTTSSCREAKLV